MMASLLNDSAELPVYVKPFLDTVCYNKVLAGHYFDGPCVQLFISKLLSYIIITVTSVFVKMPQIIKIYRAKSGDGVSLLSQFLLTIVGITGIGYNIARGFPLSVWGEMFILSVQQTTIVCLIYMYSDRLMTGLLFTTSMSLFLIVYSTPLIPMWLHVIIQMGNIPLSSSSKIIQIWTNLKNRGTGQLSAPTLTLSFLRCAGRCYSNIIETGDIYRILLYAQAATLNSFILLQVFYYNRQPNKDSTENSHQDKDNTDPDRDNSIQNKDNIGDSVQNKDNGGLAKKKQ